MPDEAAFIGSRLPVARRFRGMNASQLARAIGVTPPYVAMIEDGRRLPSDQVRDAIAAALRIPASFFERSWHSPAGPVHFRKRASTPKRLQAQYAAHVELVDEFVSYIDHFVMFPPVQLPRASISERSPSEIATDTRVALGIPDRAPIQNVTRTFEHAGVIIVELPDVPGRIDALSTDAGRPLIIRSSAKGSPSRTRFDTPHEAGHRIMHSTDSEPSSDQEDQADAFASAFMLPFQAFIAEFPRTTFWDWTDLFAMKSRWGMSLAALLYRAYELNLIDAARFRTANIYLRTRGWHLGEPYEPPAEQTEALRGAVSAMVNDGTRSPKEIVDDLGWTDELVAEVVGIDFGERLGIRAIK